MASPQNCAPRALFAVFATPDTEHHATELPKRKDFERNNPRPQLYPQRQPKPPKGKAEQCPRYYFGSSRLGEQLQRYLKSKHQTNQQYTRSFRCYAPSQKENTKNLCPYGLHERNRLFGRIPQMLFFLEIFLHSTSSNELIHSFITWFFFDFVVYAITF